jgi:uncharacterized protein YkwD
MLGPARSARPRLVLAAAVLLVAAIAAPTASASTSSKGRAAESLERSIVTELNAVRVERALRPLRPIPQLHAAAERHSREMLARGYFSHASPDGGSFSTRVRRFYRPPARGRYAVGENLLWRSPSVSASRVVSLWLNSPEHRSILLSPRWRDVGVGAVHAASAPGMFGGAPVTMVTADFGLRSP